MAANLNLEKLAQPLCASLCLGLGGNAIVLTASLIALECITAHNPGMSHLIPSPLHLRLLNPIFQLHSTALELHP
ncbi:MAG: hypothetical protein ACYC3N_10945 [Halothiobacillus sp.]